MCKTPLLYIYKSVVIKYELQKKFGRASWLASDRPVSWPPADPEPTASCQKELFHRQTSGTALCQKEFCQQELCQNDAQTPNRSSPAAS